MNSGDFAAIAVALYAAHHVGDYWVQRDVDARYKGDPDPAGRLHCLHHVLTYVATQAFFLIPLVWMVHFSVTGVLAGLAVSGVTHYIADRRAPLKRIASWIPGKSKFITLGAPRDWEISGGFRGGEWEIENVPVDNPQLATGLWALDQSWHIFWGVFVAALLMVTL